MWYLGLFHPSREECTSKLSNLTSSDGVNNMQQFWELNPNKIIISHINFNSISNKSDFLSDQMKDNVDVLTISETKIDDILFEINDFNKPFWVERNDRGGGVMLFIRENIPGKASVDW